MRHVHWGLTRWCLSLPLLLFMGCGAASAGEVRDAVQARLDAFTAAATSSGDEGLADLTRTADESFTE
jgi:hypothetical protein